MYDFNKVVDRSGTACIKWDVRMMFGADPEADFVPMWIADQDFAVLPQIQEALMERVKHPVYGYNIPTPNSIPALCSWYERRHGWTFHPDQVICGIGVVTMIRFAIEAITKPGDRVMVFSPVYDPFFVVVRESGRELVDVPLILEGEEYIADLERIEDEMKKGLSAIIMCNPHNPIGKVWKKDELAALADLCKKYNVYVLSDEVHGDIVMKGYKYTPMGVFENIQNRLIAFTAVSKTFNLAGFSQSAVIVPDKELRDKVSKSLRSAWIMGSNVMAIPVMEAAYTYGDLWVDELNAYLYENMKYVKERIEREMPKIKLCRHEGSFLMWLDMNCFGMKCSELGRFLGSKYGVGLSGGAAYGEQSEGFMRLNFACPKVTLIKGMDAIARAYKDILLTN